MAIYLDISALVAFVFGEPGGREVSDAIAGYDTRWLGDFAWGEFVDTVARKSRDGSLSPDAARATIGSVGRFFEPWSHATIAGQDITTAISLIEDDLARSLKFPDAIHLAVAKRLGATLLTLDRRQGEAARAVRIECLMPVRARKDQG